MELDLNGEKISQNCKFLVRRRRENMVFDFPKCDFKGVNCYSEKSNIGCPEAERGKVVRFREWGSQPYAQLVLNA